MIWNKKVESFEKLVFKLDENQALVCSLVWGQLYETMREKVEAKENLWKVVVVWMSNVYLK